MLKLEEICKSFPGVRALSNMKLDVAAGEIHALVGENGAGKSTLTRVIAGAHQPDQGKVVFDGKDVSWRGPREAKDSGIHVIYQEFVLFPHLSVAENIYIGHERRNRLGLIEHRRTAAEARALLDRFGLDIDPDARVNDLSVADQQMVEIAKALVHDVKLLILDEPTAVISGHEVEVLFSRLRKLRDSGVAIIYISHRLEEIFALCNSVTVMKDGQFVARKSIDEVNRDQLVALMVGRPLSELFPPKRARSGGGPVVLETRGLTIGSMVRDASIELRAGEITGLAGMVGSGRSELAFGIFGALAKTGGQILVDGKEMPTMTPRRAIDAGIGLVTEDRKGQGLAMLLDIAANITASTLPTVTKFGMIDKKRETAIARDEIDNYRVACRGPQTSVSVMSGGNQQKVIVARWARTSTRVLILDEPTRGVDVGAKAEIYRIMQELADRGIAILMISSELPEIVGMSERVIVMREGAIAGELDAHEINEEAVIGLATRHQAA